MRRKRRDATKNETSISSRATRMAEGGQEGIFGEGEVAKLEVDESLLLARVRRQLVGSERSDLDHDLMI